MGRPCKSAKVLTSKSQTKAEINKRIEIEDKIGGEGLPEAPEWLTEKQAEIFNTTVKGMSASGILKRSDNHILAEFAWSLDRKCEIERMMNEDLELLLDPKAESTLEKLTKSFFRCCNELSLSPQSRAKIANAVTKETDGTAELLKIIGGEFDK